MLSIPKEFVKTASFSPISENVTSYGAANNGYEIKDNALYKNGVKLVDLSSKYYTYISAVYDNNVYITYSDYDNFKYMTYMYNAETQTLQKLNNCNIQTYYKNYAVATSTFRTDVGTYKLNLYKLNKNGMKKIKSLAKYGRDPIYIGSSLYYVKYTNDLMNSAKLYKCSKKGTHKKTLYKVSDSTKTGMVMFTEIKKKYCEIYTSNGSYRYTYKTKKKKKI